MNDANAAFLQQVDKLTFGGELQIEIRGLMIRLSSCHDRYIALAELPLRRERLVDFLAHHQHSFSDNEQYVLYGHQVFYCYFTMDIELADIVVQVEKAVQLCAGYE
nr:hypothetical protein [uncultured Enterobacter sp.]